MQRAIRQRWPVRKRLRKRVIDALESVLDDETSTPRDLVGAARGILYADSINLTDEKRSDPSKIVGVVQISAEEAAHFIQAHQQQLTTTIPEPS